ncbi:MAG: SynChlorMet cassette radical SAM/SPASM protein ScmF [Candidatus Sabulitectum sp.]|nr:SynChlorMet cassette radical SAM/SPASM protein ScmF [Candidatus Sabulitectum sp.]
MKQKAPNDKTATDFPLKNIYFYLTKGCNLKCRHCWIAPEYQSSDGNSLPVMDIGLMQSIIEQAKPLGLAGVKLTGGEPLMHPLISDILELIHSEGLNLTIETNGILCTPVLAEQIKRSSNRLSVSVSLDGADAQVHEWVRGVPGSFDAALEGLNNLSRVGVKPQIIMSIMRRNKHQIEQVIRLAEEIGAGSVKFNPIQPTARGDAMHDALETLTIQELIELGDWVENDLSSSTPLRLHYTHPMAFRSLSRMYGDNGIGCGVCGILGILGVLAEGSYSLCGIGETVPDLVFGNAKIDRLEDVWRDCTIINELRDDFTSKIDGICGECLMNNICKAGCVAQNYYTNKSLWASYWYCEEAYEAGLFPETRLKPKSTKENRIGIGC